MPRLTDGDLVPASGSDRRATYPSRTGDSVTFFHDASEDPDGAAGAFHSIQEAITEAKRIVLIADWSFQPQARLTRHAGSPSIGEVLVKAAHDNPDLLIAVMSWLHVEAATGDDRNNVAGEELRRISQDLGHDFFPDNLLWRASPYGMTNVWSHHQKYVVADRPTDDGTLELQAFIGGLDLTRGRFDWPGHPLSSADPDRFADDWHNAEFDGDRAVVRQPWHDIHAHVVGGTPWDILDEFTARWAAPDQYPTAAVSRPVGDTDESACERVLRHRSRLQRLRSPSAVQPPADADSPATPVVRTQLLHSIARIGWEVPAPAAGNGDRFVWPIPDADHEQSIQDGIIGVIRSANEYVYIESQYFIGSGKFWTDTRYEGERDGVRNRVPEAIVRRILQRYDAGLDFHVYLVLPMFPEGEPDATGAFEVRFLQWCTIEYVVNALEAAIGDRWTDYFSVSFLASWGRPLEGLEDLGEDASDRARRVRESARYMIYVHSKLLIADDRAVVMGSANLNQRSLDGDRDTEIALAVWPADGQVGALPEVAALRRALFTEHLGADWMAEVGADGIANGDRSPGDRATVRGAADRASRAFAAFMNNEESVDARGQLCRWPVVTDGQRVTLHAEGVTDAGTIPDAPEDDREDFAWLARKTLFSQAPGTRLIPE